MTDDDFTLPPRQHGMSDEHYAEHVKIMDRSRPATPARAARWKAEDEAERDAFTIAVAAENARLAAGHTIDPSPPVTDNGVVVVSRVGPHWQVVYQLTGGTWANLHPGDMALSDFRAMHEGWDFAFRRQLDYVVINDEIDPAEYEQELDRRLYAATLCREGLKGIPNRWMGAGETFMEARLDEVVKEHLATSIRDGKRAESLWVRRGVTLFDIVGPEQLSPMHLQALARFEAERPITDAA